MQKTAKSDVAEEEGYVQDKDGNWIPDYDGTLIEFDDGDVVKGEVVRIDRDEVLVDIGYKSEGVVPINELAVKSTVDPHLVVELGDKIEAVVLQKEDKDGRLILSKKRAEYEKSWIKIEEQNKKGGYVEGRVIEIVKGGLIVDIGLRGFVPASLVDIRRVKDLGDFLGKKIECKIIEVNRNRNNVVLSRKAVIEEEKKEQREQILDNLNKGQTIKGCVSSIVPFGVFVDLDGIDGLIHISELSWDHIDHPSEVMSVGDEIDVQILEVDKERQRVSLGYKQLLENPWTQVLEKWKIGTISEGNVVKIVPFGAFVALEDGAEGLVHISEISKDHIETPKDVLSVNQAIKVKVIGTDTEKRRLNLSIKQAEETDVDAESNGQKGQSKEIKETVEIKIEETKIAEEPKIELKKKAVPKKDVKQELIIESEDSGEHEAAVILAESPDSKEKVEIPGDTSLESVLEEMKKEHGAKN